MTPTRRRSSRLVGSPISYARGSTPARGDAIVYGPGDDYALRLHGSDGRLRRIVRWHGPDRIPDPDQVAAWKDSVIATTSEAQHPAIMRMQLRRRPRHQHRKPTLTDMLSARIAIVLRAT